MSSTPRLRQALAGQNLARIAARIGRDRSTVSNYYTGKREPDLETLARLCVELGVSADWLLGLSDFPLPSSWRADVVPGVAMVGSENPVTLAQRALQNLERHVDAQATEIEHLRTRLGARASSRRRNRARGLQTATPSADSEPT